MAAKRDFAVTRVGAVSAVIGESPVWDAEGARLYWVDIARQTVNRFDPSSGDNREWGAPSTPGCVGLAEGGALVIPAQDGTYLFWPEEERFERIAETPFNPALFRFNDGRIDRQGRLWVGQMALDPRQPRCKDTGILYCFDGHVMKPGVAPIWAANGTAFSPDGRRLYRAETLDRTILTYDLDPVTGLATNEQLFATVPPELGLPDGATVDSEGGYWAALPVGPDGGSVIRFTAEGAPDFWFPTPVAVPLMVTFGGPDLATLFITSGRLEGEYGLPESPDSGSIFAVDTGYRGMAEPRFARRSPAA